MNNPKISELIDKISNRLQNDTAVSLSAIELDLVMEQIRQLYDELDGLKHSRTNANKQQVKPAKTSTHSMQPEELIIQKKLLPNEHLLLGEFADKQTLQVEKVKMEEKNTVVQNITSKPTPLPAQKSSFTEKAATINESIRVTGSLNERLNSSSGKEVHKKLASKPLKDLIDLNHRFVLLNELFKGNGEAFSAAVNHIDKLEDFDSASLFIQTQLVTNYNWDETSAGAQLLKKLVKQKFGVE